MWAFQKVAEDDDCLSNVLWTDDAHFTLFEPVNSHNCIIWATENTTNFMQTPLHDEKVTVWCVFAAFTIIGPFLFEEMRDSGFETVST